MATSTREESKDFKEIKQAAHIAILEENTKGRDFIVGDIHGSLHLFKELLEKLGNQDRLFLVGDLTDRGPQSLEVVKTILAFNASREAKGLPPIYAIRGNHEELFLDYMNKGKPSNHILLHENNGGAWVLNTPEKELEAIRDYFLSLPFICSVKGDAKSEKGNAPFTIVHALMPMSIQDLQQRISSNKLNLSEFEIDFATWARIKGNNQSMSVGGTTWDMDTTKPGIIGLKNSRGDSISITSETDPRYVIYCGHEIGKGVHQNHFNLDSGSNQSNILCYVIHQAKKCELIFGTPLPNSMLQRGHDEMNIAKSDLGKGKTITIIQKEIQFNLFLSDALRQCKLIESKLSPAEQANKINDIIINAIIKIHQYALLDLKFEKVRRYKAQSIINKRSQGIKDLTLTPEDLKQIPNLETVTLTSKETEQLPMPFLFDPYVAMAKQIYSSLEGDIRKQFALIYAKMTGNKLSGLIAEIERIKHQQKSSESKDAKETIATSQLGVFAGKENPKAEQQSLPPQADNNPNSRL